MIRKRTTRLYNFIAGLKGCPELPKLIIIDPCNLCDIGCPLCPTGINQLKLKSGVMSFETFKKIIYKIPSLEHIALYNFGEPFKNKDIFKMIAFAFRLHISVGVDSSFSFKKDDDFFTDIVQSSLEYLRVSIAGTSQETYSSYRRNGNLELVIENIKKLRAAQKSLNKNNPRIILRLLVSRFSQNDITAARKLAEDMGIIFEMRCLNVGDDLPDYDFSFSVKEREAYWLPDRDVCKTEQLTTATDNVTACPFLSSTFVVNVDGAILPCCLVTDNKNNFGNILSEHILKIWCGKKYIHSRGLFTKENKACGNIVTICDKCNNYKKISSKA